MPRIADFGELKPRDYEEIGFRSGLEIHQQLKTRKKLFCRCPAGEYSEEYHAEVLRHMRPTLSELGEYDGTALMEFKTRKEILYQLNKNNVCTYEMDDTPPFELNQEALEIALEVALLLNCNIIGELHISRKQYLDGSIPAGFQRTTILGTDGWVPYKDRRINIRQLGLEEDACREVSDRGHRRVYKTDRLSVPLIETVTYPDMKTPWETAEVAEVLRELARCTGKVRTGIGRARQDVNVSVEGGTRVEIKGVPRIPLIPRLTHFEALRQWNLLELREELRKRDITKDTLKASQIDAAQILKNTDFITIKNAIEKGWRVLAVSLAGFKGLLNFPLQPGRSLASEISDRVRVVACLDELPNIVHSEMESNPIRHPEWQRISAALGCQKDDPIVLVWGDDRDSETGAKEIIIRAREAAEGVPSETRQALPSGINGFERILPGPDRMYPDTDMPPVGLAKARIERAGSRLPLRPWERREYYRKLGLAPEIAKVLVTDGRAQLFQRVVETMSVRPAIAAVVLTQMLKHLERKGIPAGRLADERLTELFGLYANGEYAREAFPHILRKIAAEGLNPSEAIKSLGIYRMTEEELKSRVVAAVATQHGMNPADTGKTFRFLMGRLMEEIRGKVSGAKVAASLKKAMGIAA